MPQRSTVDSTCKIYICSVLQQQLGYLSKAMSTRLSFYALFRKKNNYVLLEILFKISLFRLSLIAGCHTIELATFDKRKCT